MSVAHYVRRSFSALLRLFLTLWPLVVGWLLAALVVFLAPNCCVDEWAISPAALSHL
jgi:hypothetical protein